jgi:predicted P-loop ATPase
LMLIASVNRARSPGCKFDQICVLEGPEGVNKSTVIRVLAGDENFSDQTVLNVSDREAQEQLEGVWLHESADLTGLRKAEVERVKAFASRQSDRARPAYGRVREDRPRRCTQWATTNDDAYLAGQTGNRRFWPLAVGQTNIDALRRDRDQLWGEAAALEAEGASIVLDPQLWSAATEEQEKRRIRDTWEDVIENIPPAVEVREGYPPKEVQIIYQSDGKEMVRSADVLEHVLSVQTGHQNTEHGRRLARVMKRWGWQAGRFYILGKQERGYCRDAPAVAAPEERREWLKENPVDRNWIGDDWWDVYRKVNGKVVAVKKAKTGFWYAIRGGELLGIACCPQRFSTRAEARAAVDRLVAGDDGWQWVACPD